MKKNLPIILIALVFLLGVGILSYPLVSSVINNIDARNSAVEYFNEVHKMPNSEYEKLFKEAEEYNISLTDNVILTDPFDEEAYNKIGANYKQTFNTRSDGLIGYIDVPKINVYLPIFHGTDKDVLAKAAGHLENTSFPIGGKSTHSVISAHSAYPGETFFDYLTDMKEGDSFYVHVLNRTLKYEVDQIKVVLPENVKDLYIESGKDYVTLLTCTPYTINTHRLLVRGKRVKYTEPEERAVNKTAPLSLFDDGLFFFGYKLTLPVIAILIAAFIAIVIIVSVILIKRGKKNPKHLKPSSKGGESDE